ncbi:MAG TPA: SDR family NAD(P)-dependent oxidoreductase [Steroidobacteraceae bacterium]|jgi:NAD(P)-dependent dehydrogenase (short-subunit alcohol dehydrogenase family)
MKQLKGRTAFITGGGSGIGLGIAESFLKAGMQVVLADLRADHLDAALTHLGNNGYASAVHGIRLDVTDRAAMAQAAEDSARRFGNLHVLVNNAGIGISGPFDSISYADWDFGMAVNLGGVINGLQTFLPRILAHGQGGHIVNTSSLQAVVPMPAQFVIYLTTKAAVLALSETIRPDLAAKDVGVTVLCPGPVRTNIHELAKNRPAQFGASEAFRQVADNYPKLELPGMIEPDRVGALVLQALINDEPYIFTHGEWRDAADALHRARMAAMPTAVDPALAALLRQRSQQQEPS